MMEVNSDARLDKCVKAAESCQWDATGELYLTQQDYEEGKKFDVKDVYNQFSKLASGMLVLNGSWQAGGKMGAIVETIFHRFEFHPDDREIDIHNRLRQLMPARIATYLYNSDFATNEDDNAGNLKLTQSTIL